MNNTYLYVIGGWNLTYLNEVHRLKVDAEPSPGAWEQIEGMRAARYSSIFVRLKSLELDRYRVVAISNERTLDIKPAVFFFFLLNAYRG